MNFSSNIKLLRKRRGRTQDEVAFTLKMKRSTLSGYENEVAQPGIQALLAFSDFYNVAIDTLIKVNLTELSERELSQLERGYDVYIRGSKLRILATTVTEDNEDNIELVHEKAKAGYKSGFADPEYIKILPTFQLPFLSKQRKYRTFQINGDSMLPIPDKSFVTGEYIQDWNLIKTKQAYIILTLNDGIMFKIIENRIETEGKLKLHSLNPLYDSYDLHVSDIKEVWKFINFISSEMPEPNEEKEALVDTVRELRKDIKSIQTKLNL
ncbi:MAG: helix-turn-helix domain-containing protein [Bacteroidales bacterium]|nr:helix-turn-helix domain-containing protein [Bacteroidales bacterium]